MPPRPSSLVCGHAFLLAAACTSPLPSPRVDPASPATAKLFSEGGSYAGSWFSACELNGDGLSDAVITLPGSEGVVAWYLGGSGGYAEEGREEFRAPGSVVTAACGNFSRDADGEVLAAVSDGSALTFQFLRGSEGTAPDAGAYPLLRGIGDADGDGYDDLSICEADGAGCDRWTGGAGGLEFLGGVANAMAVQWGDVTGDGADETYAGFHDVRIGNSIQVFSAGVAFRWQPADATDNFASSLALLDINGDGHLDLATTYSSTDVAVYLGSSSGIEETPSVRLDTRTYGTGAWLTDAGDIDGDGLHDLAMGLGEAGGYGVFGGNEECGLKPTPIHYDDLGDDPSSPWNAGDVNGDGAIDLAVTQGPTVQLRLGTPVDPEGVTSSFQTSTSPDGWFLGGTASLTAGGLDAEGAGWLRLTGTETNQAGYAISEEPVLTSTGLLVAVDFASWGGTVGADGISVFLWDGSIDTSDFVIGDPGLSLGYRGVSGGYVAVAADEWGNFSSDAGADWAGPGQLTNSIAVRGAVSDAHRYLDGVAVTPPLSFPNPVATRPSGADARRLYLQFVNNCDGGTDITSWLAAGEGTIPTQVLSTSYDRQPPASVKLGVAAATGDYTNNHEVKSISLVPLLGRDPMDLALQATGPENALVGEEITYTLVVRNLWADKAIQGRVVGSASDITPTGWTCTPGVGAGTACGAASGAGALADTFDLASGDTLTYTYRGTVAAVDAVRQRFSVEAGESQVDFASSDNTGSVVTYVSSSDTGDTGLYEHLEEDNVDAEVVEVDTGAASGGCSTVPGGAGAPGLLALAGLALAVLVLRRRPNGSPWRRGAEVALGGTTLVMVMGACVPAPGCGKLVETKPKTTGLGIENFCEEVNGVAYIDTGLLANSRECAGDFAVGCFDKLGHVSIVAVSDAASSNDGPNITTVSTWLRVDDADAIDVSHSPYGKTFVHGLPAAELPKFLDLLDEQGHLPPGMAVALNAGTTATARVDLKGSGLRLVDPDALAEQVMQRVDSWDAASGTYLIGTPEPLADRGSVEVAEATIDLTADGAENVRVVVYVAGGTELVAIGGERTAEEALALEEDWEALLDSYLASI